MSITTYTDLELRLQAEVADLKVEHIAYIGRTGARILALHDELGELKAKLAETERDYERFRVDYNSLSMTTVPNPRVIELYEKSLVKDYFKGLI